MSKTFRMTLITLIACNPVILMMTIVNANIPQMMFIGFLFFSLFFLLTNNFEISAAFFGLAMGMNQLGIWVTPLFWVLLLFKLFRMAFASSYAMDFG
jgi:hypothetical protein